MTAPIELVTINGKTFEASGCRLKVAGMPIKGWKSAKYSDKRTRSKVKLMDKSLAPVDLTQGEYNADQITLEMLKQTVQALRNRIALLSTDGTSFGQVKFNGSLQYTQIGLPSQNDEWIGMMWSGNDGAVSASPDPLYESVTFDVMKLKWNGVKLYNPSV